MGRRKKQYKDSGSDGEKESRIRQQDTLEEKKAVIRYIRRGPPALSWSSRMPPYCFTELCPDPARRK